MKPFFLKYYIVALIFINATFLFAQNQNHIDSIINLVNLKVEKIDLEGAGEIIDSIRNTPIYKVDSVKFKVDLVYSSILHKKKEDKLALKILLDGLLKANELGSLDYASDYAYQLGVMFSHGNNLKKAFEYYKKSANYAKRKGDSLRISKSSLGYGSIHLKIFQKYDKGLKKMDSVKMKSYRDSSLYFHNEAIDFFPKLNNDKKILKIIYDNLMIFHFYEKDYESTDKFGELALSVPVDSNSFERVFTINVLGASKFRTSKFKEAESYYLIGLSIVDGRTDFESMSHRKKFLVNLSQTYNELKQFEKAFQFRLGAHQLTDSLHDMSTDASIAEYEAKYNLSEQEKLAEIEKNKKEKALFWLYVLGTSSVVLIFILWLTNRSQKLRRDKQELVFQKENLINERRVEKVKSDAQIKILNATLDGKETERNHIAEILHDSVSALLSSAGLHLQAAKIELEDKAPEEIEKSQAIVREAGDKIRDLSHKLISSILIKFGLSYAMEDMCEKYSNSKLTFESDSKDVQRYSREFEIKIHSIIEELVNNILKHSDAENAHILLKQFEGQLQVRIFDDGKGFDVEKMRQSHTGGLGLTQIEARIKVMKGIFNVKSSKETGTRIFINVPVIEEQLN